MKTNLSPILVKQVAIRSKKEKPMFHVKHRLVLSSAAIFNDPSWERSRAFPCVQTCKPDE